MGQAQSAGNTAASLERSNNSLRDQAKSAERQQRIGGALQGAGMGASYGMMLGGPAGAGIGAGIGALGGLISSKLF